HRPVLHLPVRRKGDCRAEHCRQSVVRGAGADADPERRHGRHGVARGRGTARAGIDYLRWFAPGLGLQFLMVAMFATLRATGIVLPTMILQVISVATNVFLAPVFIVGWLTGHAMGPAGAGLASSIACVVGLVGSAYYFHKHEK